MALGVHEMSCPKTSSKFLCLSSGLSNNSRRILKTMFAHAEGFILPAILLLLVLYSASTLVLARSLMGKTDRFTVLCALTIIVVSGVSLVSVVVELEWPPEQAGLFTVLFWALPLLAGVVSLTKVRRAKNK